MMLQFPSDRDTSLAQVLRSYDTPAYVRRGVQLAEARERIFQRCQSARDEHLRGVRSHLRSLRRSCSNWDQLSRHLATEHDLNAICDLEADLRARDSANPSTTSHTEPGVVRGTSRFTLLALRIELRELVTSIERFNRRWSHFVANMDLSELNRQVDDYNRYYLLEKECAMRSPRLAARGFIAARPLTHEDLIARYPLLPSLQLRW